MKPLYLLPLLLLPACASITQGSRQSIAVETTPPGADCELSNTNGKWYVKDTPASTTIQRDAAALAISCQKGKLYGGTALESTTQAIAFGNVLAGGLIGAAIDHSSGASFAYPATVSVPLAAK